MMGADPDRPSRAKRILFAALALLIATTLLEAGLRFALSFDAVAERLLTSYDETAWRINWLNRQRSGVEVLYGFDRYDATKGWATLAGLRDVEVFDGKILNTNGQGHRGRTGYGRRKSPGVKRIVVLGDSFTFGDEVSDDETYSHYLDERLPGVQVINLGVHGYGHDQMWIVLQEIGTSYRPDVVLLGFVYDDVARNGLAFRDYAKPRFAIDGEGLRLENSPVPIRESVLASDRKRSRLVDVITMGWRRIDDALGWRERRDRRLTERILDGIVQLSRAKGAVPLLVYMPVTEEIHDAALAAEREGFLLEYCAGQPAAVCHSLRADFDRAAQQGVRIRTQNHWGPTGHRVVAEGIADFLAREGLLGD